jgi:hypothetical protein
MHRPLPQFPGYVRSALLTLAIASCLSCSAYSVQKPAEDPTQAPANSAFVCIAAKSDYMLIGGDSALSLILERVDVHEDKPRELRLIMTEVNQVYDGVFPLPAGTYRLTELLAGPWDPLVGRSGGKERAGTGTAFISKTMDLKGGTGTFLGVVSIHHEGWTADRFSTGCLNPDIERRFAQKLPKIPLRSDCLAERRISERREVGDSGAPFSI